MKKKETVRSLWTPTAGMLTGARRAAMLLLTTLLLTMTAQTAWAQSPDDPDLGGKTLVALVATVTSGSTTENYSVGDTYATPDAALKAAVENASNRSEVKLYADITAERCSLVVKKSMIIDLNGHSISVSYGNIFAVHVYEELTVKNGTLSSGSEALYVGRGVVVLENTTIRSTTPNDRCVSISLGDGTLTISKGLTLGGSIDNYQGTVQIADGQVLKYTDDGGQVQLLCGPLDADAINALANKDITFFGNAGGYCGQDNSETTDVDESKNVMWSILIDDPATADIDESKVLTISGTGAMANYNGQNMPWLDYKDDITTVVIEAGVTSIGNKAFYSFTKLESVTIPASVTQIGDAAFYGCTNLATVSGASGVTKARKSDIFYGTAWLNNLPDGLTYVGHVAYRFKGEGTSVELSDGTTQIADIAFQNSQITSISIPASVTFIGISAFRNSVLTSVTIPASVTYIDDYAFASSALQKIYSLATSAPTLGNNAFQGCPYLTDVIVPATAYSNYNISWFRNSSQGKLKPGYTVTCGEGITTTAGPLVVEDEIVTLAYSGTVPDGHTFVYTVKDADENDVTATVLSGTTLTMPGYNITVTGTTEIIHFEIDGITYEWTREMNVKVTGYNGASSSINILPSVEHNGVSYNVTEIGEGAFKDNNSLVSIELYPEAGHITVIGARAFKNCTNLFEIVLPVGLTTIEAEAFSGSGLTEITIPEGLTSIGENAFAFCSGLTIDLSDIPDNITSTDIGTNAFNNVHLTATLTDTESGNALERLSSVFDGYDVEANFTRGFSNGVASTVCLPFDFTPTGGTYYTFDSVDENWTTVTMKTAEPDNRATTDDNGHLQANTPYLFMPTATGEQPFSGTVTCGSTTADVTTVGDWTFTGTYEEKRWDVNDNNTERRIFGFATGQGYEGTAASTAAGEFIRLNSGGIKPFRAYLEYTGSLQARTRGEGGLPETMTVRLVNANGEIQGIGEIRLSTGEVTFDSHAWYDLNGRRLDGKPSEKGIYINGGRKVVIK